MFVSAGMENKIIKFNKSVFSILNSITAVSVHSYSFHPIKPITKLSRGEICVANFKAPLQMVRVWTGF